MCITASGFVLFEPVGISSHVHFCLCCTSMSLNCSQSFSFLFAVDYKIYSTGRSVSVCLCTMARRSDFYYASLCVIGFSVCVLWTNIGASAQSVGKDCRVSHCKAVFAENTQ